MTRQVFHCALLVNVAVLAGCQMGGASIKLLDGLDESLGNLSAGQQHFRQAAQLQLVDQQKALDLAFEADVRQLAVTRDDGTDAAVLLADVLEAKQFYDARRSELDASRDNVSAAFDRMDNNLSASRQMLAMLRQLVYQQNALAGQANIAVDAAINRIAK